MCIALSIKAGRPSPFHCQKRTFNPDVLDSRAAGDLDKSIPDPDIEMQYMQLPRTSYDMWAKSEQHPPGTISISKPDAAIDEADRIARRQRETHAPWSTWDLNAPVAVRSLDLTAEEVQQIWQSAQHGGAFSNGSSRVSAHDALVGHFWRLSVRARHLPNGTPVSITPAIGLRARFDPPLDPTFVSSAFILLASKTDSTTILSPSTGLYAAASAFRSSIGAATPSALSAVLHHHAFEMDPIRFRPHFCGETHTCMTSWIGAKRYDADFGSGTPTRAEGALDSVDGMLMFEDLPPMVGSEPGRKWYENGARVKMSFREEVMQRVLADPELRGHKRS